jgi:hypothetical protein
MRDCAWHGVLRLSFEAKAARSKKKLHSNYNSRSHSVFALPNRIFTPDCLMRMLR